MSTTPKLDALIESYDSYNGLYRQALMEIREHLQRIPAPQESRPVATIKAGSLIKIRRESKEGKGERFWLEVLHFVTDKVMKCRVDNVIIEDIGFSLDDMMLVNVSEVLEVMDNPKPTRYPSEIETRLIELCEKMLPHVMPVRRDMFEEALAAIKRDLGLAP